MKLEQVVVFLKTVESFLKKWGGVCVIVFGVLYYSLYWNAAIWRTGEGGSNVVIAQRLNEGWRPIKDMFIGYNLMWFLPLSWMYQAVGVNFALTQIFFFGLAVFTAWIGWKLVRQVTGWGWLAALAAGFMVLMPGKAFRNWMGFVGVLAAYAILKALVVEYPRWWQRVLWMGFAGAALSLCFLIRVEPMIFVCGVLILAIVVFWWMGNGEVAERSRTMILGLVAMVAMFGLVHLPFMRMAEKGGYGPEFRQQYSMAFQMILWELQKEVEKWTSQSTDWIPNSVGAKSPVLASLALGKKGEEVQMEKASVEVAAPPAEQYRGERRGLPPIEDILHWRGARFFALAIYFPVVSVPVVTFLGLIGLFSGWMRNNRLLWVSAFGLLVTVGCALSLFPQYFFFRPDSTHLAEFMVPYYAASAMGIWVGFLVWKGTGWAGKFWSLIAIIVVIAQLVVVCNGIFGREGSGSIRLARGRTEVFVGENGVRVRFSKEEYALWKAVTDVIWANSLPGEELVVFPYGPIFNVVTNRPTRMRKLFYDNATAEEGFADRTIEELMQRQPAVVMIDNKQMNNTERSRFRNWARPVWDWLVANYRLELEMGELAVFVRR